MKVYLRAFEPGDHELINRWRQDDSIYAAHAGNKYFVSPERDRKWVEDKIFDNTTEVYLAICLMENDQMIGYISASDLDYRNRKAFWSGFVIGDRDHRNKGYATEAVMLLLDFLFNECGMHRVYAYALEDNKVSIVTSKMLGFKQEGVMRDFVFKKGRFHNAVLLSILSDEYREASKRYNQGKKETE